VSFLLIVAAALVVVEPAAGDPAALAAQLNVADANIFSGTPAVGALFYPEDGRLTHFCTASVLRSKNENLLVTAAHCLLGKSLSGLMFAPGYHDGTYPHGRWMIRAAYTDRAWQAHQDPDDDVAFLVAGQRGRRIQRDTGGETLVTRSRLPEQVRVVGYPDGIDRPVFCDAPARPFDRFHLWQMVFFCTDYTNGTSGGPFLAHVSGATGDGQVIGVIGGYEQGGDTPSVSYSARFGGAIAALFRRAEARS
jgi:V8-like Glu-specific endopeptidase